MEKFNAMRTRLLQDLQQQASERHYALKRDGFLLKML